MGPRILHMTLTAKWFSEIASGRKKTEYRKICPHWDSRLMKGTFFRKYDEIWFRNGYGMGCPFMRVQFRNCTIKAGGPVGFSGPVYAIELGDILELKAAGA